MFRGEAFTSPIRELYLSNDALFQRLSTRLQVHGPSKSEESWITHDNLSYVRHNRLFDAIFGNKARFLSVRRLCPYPAGDYLVFEISVHILPRVEQLDHEMPALRQVVKHY